MSAAEHEFKNPGEVDYETQVRKILKSAETHMSVTDIRVELTYQENGIAFSQDYGPREMEDDIETVIEDTLSPDQEAGELDMSRIEFIDNDYVQPAEIEDTETKYKII